MSDDCEQEDAFSRVAGVIDRYESRWGRPHTAILVGLSAQLLSIVLYAPSLWEQPLRLTRSYAPMCADPFTRVPIYEPQVRHRILAPLIAFALGLRGVSGAAIPVMANTVLLTLLFLMLRRQVSTAAAALSVLLLATTLVVISGYDLGTM